MLLVVRGEKRCRGRANMCVAVEAFRRNRETIAYDAPSLQRTARRESVTRRPER
jgi:hypothetical protein